MNFVQAIIHQPNTLSPIPLVRPSQVMSFKPQNCWKPFVVLPRSDLWFSVFDIQNGKTSVSMVAKFLILWYPIRSWDGVHIGINKIKPKNDTRRSQGIP